MPSTQLTTKQVRRPSTLLGAFLIGIPLAAAILGALHFGPLSQNPEIARYVSHRVEDVEIVLFSCAMGTLLAKLWQIRRERAACRRQVLPAWNGKAVPVEDAVTLQATASKLPNSLQRTFLGQRVHAVLDFLVQRHSADDLDDQLRTLADNDVGAMEGSFALTRFITWAIPILGFLGTVLGITGAIAGITPETLDKNLNSVTDGLSFAFDATALALSLTMVTMFMSFLVERFEQDILDDVDRFIDRELAHRWIRNGADSGPFIDAVKQNAQVLLDATHNLVHTQAEIWARTLAETERRANEIHTAQNHRLTTGLETALEQTLKVHAERLGAVEKQMFDQSTKLMEHLAALANAVRDTGREQQAAIVRFSDSMAAQAIALNQLQKNEQHLLQLQKALHTNLSALAGAGSFEQAMQSLLAAIHLLTARAGAVTDHGQADSIPLRIQTGKAA